MKLRLSSSISLFALTTLAFASPPPTPVSNPGKFYVGIFGGTGSSNSFDIYQYGTAFFLEGAGGPLAVNAFGQVNHHHAPFYGVQLGYKAAQEVSLNLFSWTFRPAAELEGYTMTKSIFNGTVFNDTARLEAHDFDVLYPLRRTVFLANAVLNFDNTCFFVDPYIGIGIGNAIVRVSDATSIQTDPLEAGVNHYNGNRSDVVSTFAQQIKLGLNFDVSDCVSFFAEYRWLYLASTHFVLGSTVFPGHAETSSWQVRLNSQRYNLGNIGVRVNW